MPTTQETLLANYNPQGAMSGLFAPAYVHGFQPSETAVVDWAAQNRNMTPAMLEQTRMPSAWLPPQDEYSQMMSRGGRGGKGNVYGEGRVPDDIRFGHPGGAIDPQALRAASQGGIYDMDARRNAIAERVLANDAAKAAYYGPKQDPFGMYAGFGGGFQAPEYTGGG
jgi:hypothetical protein